MSSGHLEAPAGEDQLCVFLVRGEEEVTMREVACQWEGPEPARREVGCQSTAAERKDAAVQVDMLWTHCSGTSPGMLLQCLSVRPDEPDGGALLQHCTTTRTRTRTIKPAIRLSPSLTKSRSQRRLPPQNNNMTRRSPPQRCKRRLSPHMDQQGEQQQQQQEEEEEEEEDDDDDDTDESNWTPAGDMKTPASVGVVYTSQSAPGHVLKLESVSIMCDICGKVMKNKSSLARHSFIHTGKKPFACHLCDLRFNRRDNLQHHLSRLHPNGVAKLEKQRDVQTWLCAVCGKTFSCRSRLKAHEIIHSGVKPYHCDLCPKAYMRTNDLEHHKKIVHVEGAAEPQQPTSLLCDFCGREFKCRSQLVIHFQTHTGERPHLCDICGRKFARHHQLKRHKILLHTKQVNGEESPLPAVPFTCSVCGKRLKSEAHLAAHSHIHTEDKPHRCGICSRSFQRATCLKQHHLRVHLKVKVNDAPPAGGNRKRAAQSKLFSCPICSKNFKFKSLLASHSLIHSEVRPYACEFCSRSFRRLSHLKRHREVVHANGARPPQSFICHICGKDKKCRSQLDRHVIIHTGERPFACDLCTARFNRRGNLQQHKKRMHGVGTPASEEAPPILFDDDASPALNHKQEKTVVAVKAPAERFEVLRNDETDVQQFAA